MDSETPPDLETLPALPGATLQPTAPRLEDTFVTLLRTGRTGKSATVPTDRGSPPPSAPGHSCPQRRSNGNTLRPVPELPGPSDVAADRNVRAPAKGPVIEVRGVKRRFGNFYAVKGVTFEVERGEIFGLLGANGAGKSTTFRMLCGLLPATEGVLLVAGADLRHAAAAARARIGYMSQKFSLYGNLSVNENLRFFSSAYGLSGSRQQEQIDWALAQFELGPIADANSMDLPLGHKQRLAMACALMHDPEILFLDEPTSGVDPVARREFWGHINSLAERNVTVMVTTHFMEEDKDRDRLAIMADGEILALGTPEEIKQQQCTAEHPEPTMEDAFIGLIESKAAPAQVG